MAELPEFYPEKQGRPKEEEAPYIRRGSITAEMIHEGALDYGLSFYGTVTTATSSTAFAASGLAGMGAGAFKTTAGTPYEIYVFQADAAAPEGQMTPVVSYTTATGAFTHAAYSGGNLAVGDKVLIIHPLLASLGTKATDAAAGAVTTTDYLMAYVKQQITLQIAADIVAGNIVNDITAAVDEPPTTNSLHDILHKDGNYTYNNTTDALEALSDEIHRLHQHVFILFIIPEAVASINADNVIIQTELAKLGHLHTITQADALDFPAFGMYSLCVCGTNSGTAWTTTNLADLKTVIGLPILTVDKVAGAYFEIGTDGGDAATKTTIDAISEIEGTVMGIGETSHETVTGLAAGLNTVSSSATYHTLDMSNANITEKVFATADEDVDGGTANTDVVIGLIPQVLEDGTIGTDEDGVDVAAALGFLGFCYDASTLTTLGKGTLYLFAHMMIMTKILAPLETPNAAVVDLRKRLIGNQKNSFTNTDPLVEWISGQTSVGTKLPVGESLYDILLGVVADTEDIQTILGTPANFKADVSAITAAGPTKTEMDTGHGLLATEAKQDIIDGIVDNILLYTTTSDWKGSFNWDTSAYTTVEQDISALFSTNLALATRRKYSVKLDLTNVEADASFVSLCLAVKEKIDGTNYRAIDRKIFLKADIAALAEPGIVIDIPATSENIQITMQMGIALAGDATIYYAVVKEHLE